MPRKPRKRKEMPKNGQRLLDFVQAYSVLHGVPPSYETIAKGMGLRSKSNVCRIVHELKSRGHLTVKPHAVHSIRLVDRTMEKLHAMVR